MTINMGDGTFDIGVYSNNIVLSPLYCIAWQKYLKNNRGYKYLTLKRYAEALDRFINWSIYRPLRDMETLAEYLIRYRSILLTGDKITAIQDYQSESIKFSKERVVFTLKPHQSKTVNLEIIAIESYFIYIKEAGLISASTYSQETDWLAINRKAMYSHGSGYGLQMSKAIAEILGSKRRIIKPLKTSKYGDEDSFFPIEFFSELLSMSQHPQEKMLYLLCGAAGARIGQALNLTWNDIIYNSKDVYLIHPGRDDKSPKVPISRRIWLKEEYGIDISKDKPHNLIGSKYPIPLEPGPIFFMHPDYQNIFFKTVILYEPKARDLTKHPFVFTTSQGGRLLPAQVSTRWFKKRLQQLKKKYPLTLDSNTSGYSPIKQLHRVKGVHSLRHMFAIFIMDMGFEYSSIGPNLAKIFVKNALGHTSIKSTMIYARISKRIIQHFRQNLKDFDSSSNDLLDYYLLKSHQYRT